MAKKKGNQLRFCCDFRYLNSVTVKDAYPIPRIDESLSKLGDAKFFTTLDLGSAFWQVPLRKQDRDKTGFACELGLFQWKWIPFGLCNATASFQRLMAHALIGVTKKYGNLVMWSIEYVFSQLSALTSTRSLNGSLSRYALYFSKKVTTANISAFGAPYFISVSLKTLLPYAIGLKTVFPFHSCS